MSIVPTVKVWSAYVLRDARRFQWPPLILKAIMLGLCLEVRAHQTKMRRDEAVCDLPGTPVRGR